MWKTLTDSSRVPDDSSACVRRHIWHKHHQTTRGWRSWQASHLRRAADGVRMWVKLRLRFPSYSDFAFLAIWSNCIWIFIGSVYIYFFVFDTKYLRKLSKGSSVCFRHEGFYDVTRAAWSAPISSLHLKGLCQCKFWHLLGNYLQFHFLFPYIYPRWVPAYNIFTEINVSVI